MLRWMILAVSFALWAGCMALVYVNFKPAPRKASDTEVQSSLERLFDANAPLHRAWKIYAHPADLQQAKAMLGMESESNLNNKKDEWNGVNEKGLVFAGKLSSNLKNRQETSLDEETSLTLSFPGTPFQCTYKGRGHLTLDKGLETSRFGMKLRYESFEVEALSSGQRDGNEYVMTMLLMQNGQRLYNSTNREEVGEKVPGGGMLEPFQYRRDIEVGNTWEIRMVDFFAAVKGDKNNIIQTLPVRCVRKVKIEMEGVSVPAYEVRSEKGEARAWYSADGEVLKQTFKLAGAFDIMVVKDDEYNGKKKDEK